MMKIETDVLIVGAGPSGSMAARTLARNGVDVTIIDKTSEIGTPKRCAEGITTSTLSKVGIELDERWIARNITGIEITSTDGSSIVFDESNSNLPDNGYVLERKVFDKHLTAQAITSGARVYLRTMAVDAKRVDDHVLVTCESFFGVDEIEAKIVIAADGPKSSIARLLGLNTCVDVNNIASCIQYEMVGVSAPNMNNVYIYIGSVVPGGYIWIFPKGDDIANVGLGILKSHTDKTAKYYLDNFVASNEFLKDSEIVEVNVGGDPVGGLVKDRFGDNVLVVGDAAGFVNPLTGDGIYSALKSGYYAGVVASKSILDGDYSSSYLRKYYDLTQDDIGNDYDKYNRVKEFLLTLDDDSLNAIVSNLSDVSFEDVTVSSLIKVIIKSSPKSLLKLGKLF